MGGVFLGPPGIEGKGQELGGHFLGRQHEIDQSRGNGAFGHAIELGAFLALDHDHAAAFLDGPDPSHAIAARSGKDDSDGPLALILGQGTEKDIDGQIDAPVVILFLEQESPVEYGEIFLWWYQIDGVGFNEDTLLGAKYRHFRALGQQFHHQALVVGRQMLHHDEGHAAVDAHLGEKRLDGLQSAGRGADSHVIAGCAIPFFEGSMGIDFQ